MFGQPGMQKDANGGTNGSTNPQDAGHLGQLLETIDKL